MIEFNNVSKIYNNNVKALSDVSVKINSGDFVFLVGPSLITKNQSIRVTTTLIPLFSLTLYLIINNSD